MEGSSAFSMERYLGSWWQIASTNHQDEECARRRVIYNQINEDTIGINHLCYNRSGNLLRSVEGTGTIVSTGETPEMIVNFPDTPQSDSVNYVIYDTDYNRYAIVGSPNRRNLQFFTRDSQVSEELYDKMCRIARQLQFPLSNLRLDFNAIFGGTWDPWFFGGLSFLVVVIIIVIGILVAYFWYNNYSKHGTRKTTGKKKSHDSSMSYSSTTSRTMY